MTAPVGSRKAREVAFDHHAQRDSLADAAAGVAVQMWSDVDPGNISDSWAKQVPELTAIVSGTQVAAARTADSYVGESLDAQDIEGPVEGEVNPAAFAGASDGGSLMSLLTNPVVVTLLSIQDGLDAASALRRGRANLDGIVRTQVADAGRYADQTSLVSHRGAEGYVRVTDGNPCARCLLLSGKFFRWNRGFLRHPRCGCQHVPTLVANPRFLDRTARDFYDAMTPAQRTAAGFSRDMQRALDEGADLGQVVNATTRRGAVYEAGGRQFTLEGTTRLGAFGRMARRQGRAPIRITPNQIFREATSRDEAIRLLRAHGYLLDAPVPVVARPGVIPLPTRIRPALVAAGSADEVSAVLVAELRRITGRNVDVRLSGSVATAREHAEGLLRTVERYPGTPLTSVRTGPLPFARYAESERGVITFSEHWSSVEGRTRYLAALRADERRGWHPYSTPDGVASHEVVHVLDPDVPIESIVGRRQVTGYAARSEHEAVAEAVADVMVNGERASVLSREITAAVDDAYAAGRIVGRRPRLARPGPPSRLSPPARGGPQARAAEAELQRLTVPQLKAMARERGIPGYTAMRKQELVDALSAPAPVKAAKAAAKKAAPKATKAPAAKAAPAKKAPAKKAPAPKPLPAPERMTGPALRKELEAAGVQLPAKVGKPDLQRWVTELRAAPLADKAAIVARIRDAANPTSMPSRRAGTFDDIEQALAARPRQADFADRNEYLAAYDAWRDRYLTPILDGEFAGIRVRPSEDFGFVVVAGKDGSLREVILSADLVKNGREVGRASRRIYRDRNGDLVAEHQYLEISRSLQGSGFAEQFNENLFDWYRRSGVRRVELTANVDVGGYAWASRGFDFADAAAAREFLDEAGEKIAKALRSGRAPRGVTREELRELGAYIEDMRLGRRPAHAPDIARFGRKPGQKGKTETWAGKWLMLGSSWRGRLLL